MSRLVPNSTPAERAVGCSFAENFESEAKVVANGGEIFGTPTIDFGAVLDGVNDYIKYDLTGNEFTDEEVTAVLEFIPNFEADDDERHYLITTAVGAGANRFNFYKWNTNSLFLDFGSVTAMNIPLATYQSYWLVGQRNVLVIANKNGDNQAWLNGNQIESSSVATSPVQATALVIGSRFDGLYKAEMTVLSFKNFKSFFTAQDALNFYNQDTYAYRQNALLDLPMQASEHDPSNVRTLDVSGNANHAVFGDEVTPTTYPTKKQKRGYSGDGDTDRLKVGEQPLDLNSNFTIAGRMKANVASTDGFFSVRDGGSDGVYSFLHAASLEFRAFYNSVTAAYFVGFRAFSFAITYDVSGDMKLYIDGVLRDTQDISAQTISIAAVDLFIMSLSNGAVFANSLEGEAYEFLAAQELWSPLQVQDLHIRMLKQVNCV